MCRRRGHDSSFSSSKIQATWEHQVLKDIFQSVNLKKEKRKKAQVVSSNGASDRVSLKEQAELSICHLYFDIQVPFF